jgi:hypothetical protein
MTKEKLKHFGIVGLKSMLGSLCFLMFLSCGDQSAYKYRSLSPAMERKPVSKIEKIWVARHEYDHERRLLVPKLGGARWGAVQEYKEDGKVEFKDWWERDVKIEDLEATPSTALSAPQVEVRKPLGLELGADLPSEPSNDFAPVVLPETSTDDPPSSFPAQPFPALPDESLPAFPPLGDSPSGEPDPSLSPFAPLPGALPGDLPDAGLPPVLPDEGGDGLPPMQDEGVGEPKEENPFPELPPDPFG